MWRIIRQNALSLTIMILLVAGSWFAIANGAKKAVYDCSMAEWHPDYPPKVKEACRELQRSNTGKYHDKDICFSSLGTGTLVRELQGVP